MHFVLGKGKQRRGVTSAAFSTTSYFVVVKSLSVDFYTVHKYPSSFLPFGSKYDVKLIFEENTFGDDDVAGELEFKVCNSKRKSRNAIECLFEA